MNNTEENKVMQPGENQTMQPGENQTVQIEGTANTNANTGAQGEMFEEDLELTMEQKREKAREAFKFPEEARRGVLKLWKPMLSKDKEVTELHYDFSLLSGKEVIDCFDVAPNASNETSLTNKQALFLFSAACGKMEREISGLDAVDVRAQLSPVDMVGAVRVGRSFFAHSLLGAHLSIFKM